MKRYNSVDEYMAAQVQWQEELLQLREILLSTELEETVKWGAPIYTVNGKNIVGLGAFKSYVGLWFHQGALLSDPHKKLINAQEGVTKALRQWRFPSAADIDEKLIREYVAEAIRNQKEGKEIKPPRTKPLIVPPELQKVLKDDTSLNAKFEAFGRSKKREFADYISEAKREETKLKRLEKIVPMILDGVGLNDKYR